MFKLNKPTIVVNFKVYKESTGNNAIELAKTCEDAAIVSGSNIVLAVDAIDLKEISKTVALPIIAQHVDGEDYGSHTGKILPEMVKSAGGVGSLINHSEDRISIEKISKAIEDCKKEKILSLVCVKDVDEAKKVATLNPNVIAIEPPELIGGNISVTSANPSIVSDTVKAVKAIKNIPVLCGAGIKNGKDVAKAIELGSSGVLIASGVDKSKNPREALVDLIEGTKNV